MRPEQLAQHIRSLPDPRTIPPKDAQDTLAALVSIAKATTSVPEHVDQVWLCSNCKEAISGEPVFEQDRAVCQKCRTLVPVPGPGPQLGRIATAEAPAPEEETGHGR